MQQYGEYRDPRWRDGDHACDGLLFDLDSVNVYYLVQGSTPGSLVLMGMPVGGGSATVVGRVEGGPNGVNSLAWDHTAFYWADNQGNILTAPVAGGTPTPLALAQPEATSLVASTNSLYWVILYDPPIYYDAGTPGIMQYSPQMTVVERLRSWSSPTWP